MKKLLLPITILAFTITCFVACDNDDIIDIHDNNTNITIKDSDDEFSLSTKFSPDKTEELRDYLDEEFGENAAIQLNKGNVDATITLDDNAIVYIKSSRGKLKIKIDKNNNSEEAYYKVKKVCNGVKDVLKD